jgi:ABC-2 type transport system ATP-binding protein
MSRASWVNAFEEALLQLGLEPARAQQLAMESAGHAADAGRTPEDLLGPAPIYARNVVAALQTPQAAGDAAAVPRGPVLLSLEDVSKGYRGRRVLDRITLTVRAGEVAAVVGANGSGKSTLLKICAGLSRPDSGTVLRRGTVGYVPQDGGTVSLLTAQEHFVLFGAAAGVPRARARSTGRHLSSRLSWRPDPRQRVEQLSGGTRQKLNLVLGELHAPDVLLLDEPYQGFDQGSYVNFWQQVWHWRDAGKAIVVVTHLLHELDQVDHLVDLTLLNAQEA